MQIFTFDLFEVAKKKYLAVWIHNSVVVAPKNHSEQLTFTDYLLYPSQCSCLLFKLLT